VGFCRFFCSFVSKKVCTQFAWNNERHGGEANMPKKYDLKYTLNQNVALMRAVFKIDNDLTNLCSLAELAQPKDVKDFFIDQIKVLENDRQALMELGAFCGDYQKLVKQDNEDNKNEK
jgi:hypothetical protein